MNIVLIGMPSCGKSTIGVILAKTLNMDFIDTDLIIQKRTKKFLYKIIEDDGINEFLNIENKLLSEINVDNSIIATGGSAVFGKDGMRNLKNNALVIYLKISPATIEKRIKDIKTRGVVMRTGETVEDIYKERSALYEKYADITISLDRLNTERSVDLIVDVIKSKKS